MSLAGTLRLTRKVARLYPQLLAQRLGLPLGARPRTRFVIIGTYRTGSNYLRSLLNSHPQALVYGEMFRDQREIGWDLPLFPGRPEGQRLFEDDCARFLDHALFGRYPAEISAVGFKLFYDQARAPTQRALWEQLQDRRDIKIVHLRRQDLLATYLSLLRAHRTGRCYQRRDRVRSEPPIALAPEACLEFFERTRAHERAVEEAFAAHHLSTPTYESLCADEQAEVSRLCEFLELPRVTLRARTVKQASRPLSEAIANYEQLRRRFERTPWAELFSR